MSTSSYNGNSMPIIGVCRRDGEPKSKKRRLLEATEIEIEKEMNNFISKNNIQNDVALKKRSQQYMDCDISGTNSKGNHHVTTRFQQRMENNNRIPSEIIEITENEDEIEKDEPGEDLLSKLCSAVGIDSDLTVEEVPYHTAPGMVQIQPEGINPSYYQMQRPNPNMMSPMPVPYDPRYNQVRHMHVNHPESQSRYPYSESQPRYPYSYHQPQHYPQFVRQNSHPMYPNNNPYYQQHQHYRPRYYMTSGGPVSPTEVRSPTVVRSTPPPSYQENIQQKMRSNSQNIREITTKPSHSYQTRHAVRIANQQEALNSSVKNSDVPKSDIQKNTQTASESIVSTPKSFESCTYSQQGLPKGHMDLVSSGPAGPQRNNGFPVVARRTTQIHQDGQHMNKAITSHQSVQKQGQEMYYNDRKLYPPYHGYPQNMPNHNYSPGMQAPQYRFENQRGCSDKIMVDNEVKSNHNFMKTVPHNPSINTYPPPYMNQYNFSNIERHPNIPNKELYENYPVSPKELSQSQSSACRQMAPHMFRPQQRLRHPAIIQNSPAYGPNYGGLPSQDFSNSNSMSSPNMQTSPHRLVSPQGQMSPHGANVMTTPTLSPRLHSPGGLPPPNRITPPQNLPPPCRLTPPQHRLPSPQNMAYPQRVQSPQQLSSYTTVVAPNPGHLAVKHSVPHQTLPHIKEVPRQSLDTNYSQYHQRVNNVPQNPSAPAIIDKVNQINIESKQNNPNLAFNASKPENIEIEKGRDGKTSGNTCEQESKSLSQLYQREIKLQPNINCVPTTTVGINKDIQFSTSSASFKKTDEHNLNRINQGTGIIMGAENKQLSHISSPSASRSFNYEGYNECSLNETSNKKETVEELTTMSNKTKSLNEPKSLKRKMVDDNESQNIEPNIASCKNYNVDSTLTDNSKIKKIKMTEHPESPPVAAASMPLIVDESMPMIAASMPMIEECPTVIQKKNNNYFTSFQEVFTASVKTNLSNNETPVTKSSETKLTQSTSENSSDTDNIKTEVSSPIVENQKNIIATRRNSEHEKSEINFLDKDVDIRKNEDRDYNSKSVEMKQLDKTRPMSAPGSSYQTQDVCYTQQNRPASQPTPEIITNFENKEKYQITPITKEEKENTNSELTKSDEMEVKDDDISKIVDEIDTNTETNKDDDIFVSRLRLVLEDLVSVPEASDLKPLLSTPSALLSAMVKKGGYEPSSHICAKQRLRQDFLSVLHLCLDPAQLSAWGWNKSSPDYILQQLVKVQQQGGFEQHLKCQDDYLNSLLKISASNNKTLSCETGKKLDIENSPTKNISNSLKLDVTFQATTNTQKSLNDNDLPALSSETSTKGSNTNTDVPTSLNDNDISLKKNNESEQTIISDKTPENTPTNTSDNTNKENEICNKVVKPHLETIKIEPNISVSEIAISTSSNVIPHSSTTIYSCAKTNSITNTSSSSSTESSRLSTKPITSESLSANTDKTILCSTKVLSTNITNPPIDIYGGSKLTATTISTTESISKLNKVDSTDNNIIPISSTISLINTTNTSVSKQNSGSDDLISPTTPKTTTNINTNDDHTDRIIISTSVISDACKVSISDDSLQAVTNSSTPNSNEGLNSAPNTTATAKSEEDQNNVTTLCETPGSSKSFSSDSKSHMEVTSTPELCKSSSSDFKPNIDAVSSPNTIDNIKPNETSAIHHNVITSTASTESKSLSSYIINNSSLNANDKSNQKIDGSVIKASIIDSESTSKKTDQSSPDVLNTNLVKTSSSNEDTSISS